MKIGYETAKNLGYSGQGRRFAGTFLNVQDAIRTKAHKNSEN